MKKRKGMKLPAAIAIIAVCTGLSFLLGYLFTGSAGLMSLTSEENERNIALAEFAGRLQKGDIEGLFENAQKLTPTMDSKASYDEKLLNILSANDPETLQVLHNEEGEYRLYADDTYIAPIDVVTEEDGFRISIPIHGEKTCIVEVPAGLKISANGQQIGSDKIIEKNVDASNFEQVRETQYIPKVDLYELDGLIGMPDLQADNGKTYALIEDPITGHLLMGEEVTDSELLRTVIDDAILLAKFPAQEATLGEVSNVALTSSSWYNGRYTGVQNYWFTAHAKSEFSNEKVLKAVSQGEDSFAAHVVFDYFADNGEVHRTWHIGYQLTMVNTPNGWKIAATAINNELNPGTIIPE